MPARASSNLRKKPEASSTASEAAAFTRPSISAPVKAFVAEAKPGRSTSAAMRPLRKKAAHHLLEAFGMPPRTL